MTPVIAESHDARDGSNLRRRNLRLAVILGILAEAFYGGFILMHWK